MDLLSLLLQLAFIALFGVAVWRYMRRPGTIELTVVGIFGTVAAVFTISLLGRFVPGVAEALQPVSIVLLLAQPMLVVRLIGLITALPRWVLPVVFVSFLAATVGVLLPSERLAPALLFLAGYFVIVQGAGAAVLLHESRRRLGLPRVRLLLAGVATALFGVAVALASVGAALSGGAAPAEAQLLARLAALAAAIGYLGAFMPSGLVGSLGQRAVAFDYTRLLVATPSGTEPGVLWRNLALAAQDILGTRRVNVLDLDGHDISGDEEAEDPPRAPTMETIEVPITSSGRQVARLRADLDGRPVFIEDDMAVIALLGTLTARAVEREDAVVALAETRRLLDATSAARASDARFRALLEAHPNAVLAADFDGTVSWATGPTGDVFGRSARELVGTPLRELIQLDGVTATEQELNGRQVRRVETSARRHDGTAFPADVTLTNFELDGREFQLVVVSDASWRHETAQLRDRFIGILSHELRTPITSIYGGTQILLRRDSRLDDESRQELLLSVAAESERLERIIENLLVLARVERGAEFFEPHPVVIRPVLNELVARERGMLPEMTINLSLPLGLPLVAADEEYLTLILRNLLSNAAKYAGPRATVDIEAVHGDGEVIIRVRDDGPGISAEEAEHLFSLYYRSASSKPAPGAGIGLFVCRGLVLAMDGRIWAAPVEDGGGAEFAFSLPLHVEEAESAGARRPARAGRQPAPVSPARDQGTAQRGTAPA